jgi:hypothetical protein
MYPKRKLAFDPTHPKIDERMFAVPDWTDFSTEMWKNRYQKREARAYLLCKHLEMLIMLETR